MKTESHSKKALWILLISILTLAAFGQGRVRLQNDSGSLIQLTSSPNRLFTADVALAGQPVPTTGPLPSGIALVAGLYAGTSSASLALVGSVVLNPVGGTGAGPGILPGRNITLPFPGGSLAYMQIKVWDAAYASYEAQQASGVPDYSAIDNIFTMTPGTTVAYPSILTGGGSTWGAVGNETPVVVYGSYSPPLTFTYVTNNGTITITGYTGPGGAVTIPSTINGLPVTGIGVQAFYQANLTGVLIPNSVTNIGDQAFENSRLISVTIPSSVANIGGEAFLMCSGLTSINVDPLNPAYSSVGGVLFNKDQTTLIQCPGALTGVYAVTNTVINIGEGAFGHCTSLTNITIPNSVASIGDGAFQFCTSLTNITIPNTVINISPSTFQDCSSLTGVTIGNSVTSIGANAFADCPRLTGVTIPNGVTSIGDDAFLDCSSLTSITIPPGLTSIGAGVFAFTGLTNVTIPGSVTSIGRVAFYYCYHLASVTISNGVATIGDQAFWECTSLTNITMPQSVTSIGFEVFDSCSSLTTITVDSLNSNYSSMDGILFDKSRSTLIECPPGKSGSYTIPNGVTRIADNAFEYCLELTDVTVPYSVTRLGDFVFQQCHNLTRITILGGVASIGYEDFFACLNLTMVILPGTLTSIGPYAFDACSSLTTIVIPAGVTNIGDDAFFQTPTSLYFLGNAPSIGNSTFGLDHGIAYYLPGTTGWAPTLGGLPTSPWVRPSPLILTTGPSFGVQSNAFGFIISWATNISVVVEASSSLDNPNWSSLQTNTLIGGWCYFSDSQWTNYPARYYRVRSP